MKKILWLLSIFFLLNGCSKESTLEQQIVDALIKVNEKEKLGIGYVKKLNQHEQKEQLLFSDTMELTQQRYTEIEKIVVTLQKSASERLEIVTAEQQVVHDARIEVDRLEELMDTLEPDQRIVKLLQSLTERYDMHDQFVANYKKLIEEQVKLYERLEDRSIRTSILEAQVNEVNRLLEAVRKDVNEFNEATSEVNRLKLRILASLEKVE